jgi:HPr kinase/phosphorylase
MTLAHGTCVELDGAAVLLRGPSGSGKSDLALRLIDSGARLVADDQVLLQPRHGRLFASAPAAIAGRMEVRGLGIMAQPHLAEAPLALVVDLVPPEAVERLPEPATVELVGISLPLIKLAPFEASVVAKLRLALRRPARRLKAVG